MADQEEVMRRIVRLVKSLETRGVSLDEVEKVIKGDETIPGVRRRRDEMRGFGEVRELSKEEIKSLIPLINKEHERKGWKERAWI